ncbi:helix-turn-helix domain-containing protein [Jiangella endophytica]|uniref:helix-turn-helix domain-containing protein n=1 Tax=Jiangella endophytica TaxID=1623398 RepID=UPI0018E4E9A9|nr:helix-turn-helix transcriptional regulator [Jiangella endophytica]
MPAHDDVKARKADFLMAFGESARARRATLGLTQRQLDARMGYRGKFSGGVERGARNLTLDNLYLLAAALDTDPRDLLAGS